MLPTATAQITPDAQEIDRFVVEEMTAHNLPGLALAITRGDEVAYLQGYGSVGVDQPMTPQTQLFIASLRRFQEDNDPDCLLNRVKAV